MKDIPQYHALFEPTFTALKASGGSGSVEEIDGKVLDSLDVPKDALERLHNPEQGNKTEIEYRLAWARTYLKKCGLINNSTRGSGPLRIKRSDCARSIQTRSSELVREQSKQNRKSKKGEGDPEAELDGLDTEWRSQLFQPLDEGTQPSRLLND